MGSCHRWSRISISAQVIQEEVRAGIRGKDETREARRTAGEDGGGGGINSTCVIRLQRDSHIQSRPLSRIPLHGPFLRHQRPCDCVCVQESRLACVREERMVRDVAGSCNGQRHRTHHLLNECGGRSHMHDHRSTWVPLADAICPAFACRRTLVPCFYSRSSLQRCTLDLVTVLPSSSSA